MDVINKRRSIRKFSDKPLKEELILKLIKAAMQAPSAGNQRPWEFIVVNEQDLLTALSPMSPYSGSIAKAPAAIIALANQDRLRFPENWQQDMSAAIENILLEAASLGLGATWLGVSPLKEREQYIIELFGLPKKIIPFCVIPVGYPAEGQENKFIDRFEKERIFYNKYQSVSEVH